MNYKLIIFIKHFIPWFIVALVTFMIFSGKPGGILWFHDDVSDIMFPLMFMSMIIIALITYLTNFMRNRVIIPIFAIICSGLLYYYILL